MLLGTWLALMALSSSGSVLAGQVAPPGRACGEKDELACHEVVSRFLRGRPTEPSTDVDDVRHALAVLEERCRSGSGRSCYWVADFSARGIPGVMAVDRSRARGLLEEECGRGAAYACTLVERLTAGPPSEATRDAVREAVARWRMSHRRPEGGNRLSGPRPICLTFASKEDLEGTDPPAEFLARFDDASGVRPGSWCRSRKEGDLLALGPVTRAISWPPAEGLVTWYVFYGWSGRVSSDSVRLVRRDGVWVPGPNGTAPPPPSVSEDRATDRSRIGAEVARFVEAWNRREPLLAIGAMARSELSDRSLRRYTRLERTPGPIEFGGYGGYVRVRLTLHGTFEPHGGRIWPIEPWKQQGAVSPVELDLLRTGGWWRGGDWRVELVWLPWTDLRGVS